MPIARATGKLAASETTVFPGIREILNELSERLPLLIATSKPRALAEPLLDALGLRHFLTAVIGPELDSENEQKAWRALMVPAVTVGQRLARISWSGSVWVVCVIAMLLKSARSSIERMVSSS